MNIEQAISTDKDLSFLTSSHEHPRREIIVEALSENDRGEVLKFLSLRPLHTVIMAGWILDHGIVSPMHRGDFYGCRNAHGKLEAVALVGRTTMFESRSAEATAALVDVARSVEVRTVFSEPEPMRIFWSHYARNGQRPRLECEEQLYECRSPIYPSVKADLRTATMAELDLTEAAHAEMVKEETGVDPRESDREGFRQRCAHRIEANRVWVSMRHGELIFKADIVAETSQVTYFEGVWVNPAYRGQRVGSCHLSSLTSEVVSRGRSACFFVNKRNKPACRLYPTLGCQPVASYLKYLL